MTSVTTETSTTRQADKCDRLMTSPPAGDPSLTLPSNDAALPSNLPVQPPGPKQQRRSNSCISRSIQKQRDTQKHTDRQTDKRTELA